MAGNRFTQIAAGLESVPQNQRPGRLIDEICKQMQQTGGNVTPQQLGSELQQEMAQIVKAFQHQQQGSAA